MGLLSLIGGLFTGGASNVVSSGIELADKYMEDTDKKNDIIGQVVLKSLDHKPTIPLLDGIHKLGRQAMMAVLAYWYYESWKAGNPIPVETFMMIAGGPALYTVMKGVGNK